MPPGRGPGRFRHHVKDAQLMTNGTCLWSRAGQELQGFITAAALYGCVHDSSEPVHVSFSMSQTELLQDGLHLGCFGHQLVQPMVREVTLLPLDMPCKK